jgi:hypothetical protein
MSFPVAWVKVGQTIANNAFYQINDFERLAWINNDKVNTDIGSGDLTVARDNSGNENITDVSDGIAHLNNRVPQVVAHDFISERAKEENTFISTTDFNTVSGTTEHPYLLFKNPNASGVLVEVTHLHIGLDNSSARSVYRIYTNPTTTADGTALTERNMFVKSGAASPAVTTFKNPTVTANGNLYEPNVLAANSNSRGVNRYLWLAANNTLLVTVENSVSNAKTLCTIWWTEEPE